ncbi:MAG: leucine-rich repeat domain-containing protein [Muribaculaceae bacterium]|nr:leucine-rich repeat domain-containing protein [Muribaculaceae bacterium]
MIISTSSLKKVFGGAAFGILFVAGSADASAAAAKRCFIHEGIVYEISGNTLSCPQLHPSRAANIPVLENQNNEKVADDYHYTGDIVLPDYIDYQGPNDSAPVRYTITNIDLGFLGEPITSLTMPNTVTKMGNAAFKGCENLVTVKLSEKITSLSKGLFENCVSLKEFSIPAGVTTIGGNLFKGCTALEKITFEASDKPIDFPASNLTESDGTTGIKTLKEVYAYRQLKDDGTMAGKPFRGKPALETVVLGPQYTAISPSTFENCSALKNLTIQGTLTELGTNAFAGTAITEFTLPAGVTTIPSGLFTGAKSLKKVTLTDAVTGIDAMAFRNTGVSEINLPDGITYISDMAFQNAKLQGSIALPAALTRIGTQAFAGNPGITEIKLGAAVKTVGEGAFMGDAGLAKIVVDAANETFAVVADNSYLADKAVTTLMAFAPKSDVKSLALPTVTTVAPYACYGALGLETVDFPACYNYGDYSFLGAGLKSFAVKGLVGRYVAQDCKSLETLSIEGIEVPTGIAAGCEKLATVNLPEKVTVVKQDAFKGTAALKSLNLGSLLSIIEAGAFDNTGLTELSVGATYPAVMPEGVFNEAHAGVTAKVPTELVATYKAAEGWKNLNIVGDANIVAGGADMGMPAGLYYAGEDGNIHCVYSDGQTDSYDVGGLPHTFQLLEFSNRIYGASAGNKFVWSATGDVDGDGKLFYISKVGGENLLATVLDNAGKNAYKDPFGLYLYGEDLYVNDRNVCIRKIPASGISLSPDFPSWMENNWMCWYNNGWSYGCVKAGFSITSVPAADGNGIEPLYWVGMKYNGFGIYRFRQSDIGTSAAPGPQPKDNSFFTKMSPIFTTFAVDEAHGHLYVYIEKIYLTKMIDGKLQPSCWVKGGLYRVNIADLEANPNSEDFFSYNPVLVDGAPVFWEGSSTNEHVGISQLSIDAKGEYMYWCYREPTEAQITEVEGADDPGTETRYKWAETYDATNPLHHDAIKRVKLGEAEPKVEVVAPGVRGYGVVAVNYEGSTKPTGALETIVVDQPTFVANVAGALVANVDVALEVFDTKGMIITRSQLAAGESFDTAALEAGVYVAVASANGAQQVVKFAK